MPQYVIAFVLGTMDAALPEKWRSFGRRSSQQFMGRCGIASGLIEAVLALWLLRLWYLAFFGAFTGAYVRSFVAGGKSLQVAPEIAGGAGFAVLAVNPITWIILYFVLEGMVRATAAAATGDVFGVLPVCAMAFVIRRAVPKAEGDELPLVADEVLPGDGSCEFKIASCRKRPDWTFPFTIRYRGGFFQVNDSQFVSSGPRPHTYSFRRLREGENARGLRDYHPEDVLTQTVRGPSSN